MIRPTEERTKRMSFNLSMMCTALAISQMSTCKRRAVGCVLTKDKHIVSTGYNGSIAGTPHCLDVGCLLSVGLKDQGRCIRTIHAEANAAMRCEYTDTAYCTDQPCIDCTKLLLAKGVETIYYWRSYEQLERDVLVKELYKNSAVISIIQIDFTSSVLMEKLREEYVNVLG